MATHFRFHPDNEDDAPSFTPDRFPSDYPLSSKRILKIPPKNGTLFNPGQTIKLEFPSEGFLDTLKTTLAFDVDLIYNATDGDFSYVRFQNSIGSIFKRVRLMYGSTPIEDIQNYNTIERGLTEWTSAHKNVDQGSINKGVGGVVHQGTITNTLGDHQGGFVSRSVHVRQNYIHGKDFTTGQPTISNLTISSYQNNFGAGTVPNALVGPNINSQVTAQPNMNDVFHPSYTTGNPTRRYQIQLSLGMFNQKKLIPLKFMASQLSIEIELEQPKACMYYRASTTWSTQPNDTITFASGVGTPAAPPTYQLHNVNLVASVKEFGADYDSEFLKQLKQGITIPFNTWNNYTFTASGSPFVNLQIPERARSVKSVITVLKRDPVEYGTDSGACFFDTNISAIDGASTLQNYQYKIGGKFYPEEPILCSSSIGSKYPGSACEAFKQLRHSLNLTGHYDKSTENSTITWAHSAGLNNSTLGLAHTILPEFDYDHEVLRYKYTGAPVLNLKKYPGESGNTGNPVTGSLPSNMFAMTVDLRVGKGTEIAGLNAENARDINLIARYSGPQQSGFMYYVFTLIDSMFILKDNNEVQIIQ